MMRRIFKLPVAAAMTVGLAGVACGGAGSATAHDASAGVAGYVAERRTDDRVDSVVIASGSIWGATAALVETLSIGAEVGADPYMFGSITDAWATEDRIYVIDAQIPAVRAFDRQGRHVGDLGSPGQGPGEYAQPAAIAVTEDGRIAVADAVGSRINLYDRDGALLEDWPLQAPKSTLGLTVGADGRIYTQAWNAREGRMAMREIGPGGLTGEPRFPPLLDFDPPRVSAGKGMAMIVPFAPGYTWAYAPGGEMIAGTGATYDFEIHRPDGTVAKVRRYWDPVPVEPAEAAYRARLATRAMRQMVPELTVDLADLPAYKPAFTALHADRAGRLWIIRQGEGRPDPDCARADAQAVPRLVMATPAGAGLEVAGKPGRRDPDEPPEGCWTDSILFDLFEIATGDYLGAIASPEPGFHRPLFADADTVLAAVLDETGTARLKVFRLQVALP